MAASRRRQQRQQAVDIASCVGVSFGGKRVEWEQFIRTGELIIWDRHPLPMTPEIKAEMERLKQHEAQLNGGHSYTTILKGGGLSPVKRISKQAARFVKLFLKDDMTKALQGALRNAGDSLRSVGKQMTAIGGSITGALTGAAALFAKVGSDIADMSARTGVSTNALSEFGHAAGMTGASLADVEAGIRKMHKTLSEAQEGSKGAIAALAQLGLTASQLKGMKPEDQFALMAKRLAAIQDPAQRTALAMELFGKSGTKLLPMMQNLDALVAEAKELGLSISPEQAAAADALGDAWDRLKGALTGVAIQIGGAVAPLLTELSEKLKALVVPVVEFIKHNQDLVVAMLAVGGAITAAGGALTALGVAATTAATLIGALMSPLGAVAIALAGIGAAVIHFGVGWDNALSYAKTFFENARGFFANFQENMAVLTKWLQENWKNLFVDLGRLVLVLGKNWINNFRVTLETLAKVAHAVFRRVFTVDFLMALLDGIKKALPVMVNFAVKVGTMMAKALAGQITNANAAIEIAKSMKELQSQVPGAKQSLQDELAGILGEGIGKLKIFDGFQFSTEGPALNLQRPDIAQGASPDNSAAEAQQKAMLDSMARSMQSMSNSIKSGNVPLLPSTPSLESALAKLPQSAATQAAETAGTAATPGRGTSPLGVTFSAEAAVASGFRGGPMQMTKQLQEVVKVQRDHLEWAKAAAEELRKLNSGLVYS